MDNIHIYYSMAILCYMLRNTNVDNIYEINYYSVTIA